MTVLAALLAEPPVFVIVKKPPKKRGKDERQFRHGDHDQSSHGNREGAGSQNDIVRPGEYNLTPEVRDFVHKHPEAAKRLDTTSELLHRLKGYFPEEMEGEFGRLRTADYAGWRTDPETTEFLNHEKGGQEALAKQIADDARQVERKFWGLLPKDFPSALSAEDREFVIKDAIRESLRLRTMSDDYGDHITAQANRIDRDQPPITETYVQDTANATRPLDSYVAAATLLKAIDLGVDSTSDPLYRGIDMERVLPGQFVGTALMSFTRDPAVAASFGNIVLVLPDGAEGVDTEARIGGPHVYPREREFLTGGDFTVQGFDDQGRAIIKEYDWEAKWRERSEEEQEEIAMDILSRQFRHGDHDQSTHGNREGAGEKGSPVVTRDSPAALAARATLNDAFPSAIVDILPGFSTGAVQERQLNATVTKLAGLAKEWPGVAGLVDRITIEPIGASYGSWSPSQNRLALSADLLNDTGEAKLREQEKFGWNPKGGDDFEYVAIHEFGHIIEERHGNDIAKFVELQRSADDYVAPTVLTASAHTAFPDPDEFWQRDNGETWAELFASTYVTPEAEWTPSVEETANFVDDLKTGPSPSLWSIGPSLEQESVRQVRHGDHDQSSHGNRDGTAGGESPKGRSDTRPLDITRAEGKAHHEEMMRKLWGYSTRTSWPDEISAASKELKAQTYTGLKTALEGNEVFHQLDTRYPPLDRDEDEANRGGVEGELVRMWAGTSADNSASSIAMQNAAQEAFGIEDAYRSWERPKPLTAEGFESISEIDRQVAVSSAAQYEMAEPGARAEFLKAMYAETQADLKEKGIDGLYVYRGMDHSYLPAGHTQETVSARERIDGTVQLQPLSAFSLDPATAITFALGPTYNSFARIQAAWVPADRIVSYPGTGFGSFAEQEVVVMGGEATVSEVVFRGREPFDQSDVEIALMGRAVRAPRQLPEFESPDAELRHADWTKTVWDDIPEMGTPEFEQYLRNINLTLEQFQRLPVYQHRYGTPASVLRWPVVTFRHETENNPDHSHDPTKGGGGGFPESPALKEAREIDEAANAALTAPKPPKLKDLYRIEDEGQRRALVAAVDRMAHRYPGIVDVVEVSTTYSNAWGASTDIVGNEPNVRVSIRIDQKSFDPDEIAKIAALNERYLREEGAPFNVGGATLDSLITHEYGHAVAAEAGFYKADTFGGQWAEQASGLSHYALRAFENKNGSESFAEMFSAMTYGESHPPAFAKFLTDHGVKVATRATIDPEHFRCTIGDVAKEEIEKLGITAKRSVLSWPVLDFRHGDHDQSEHGNWAHGGGKEGGGDKAEKEWTDPGTNPRKYLSDAEYKAMSTEEATKWFDEQRAAEKVWSAQMDEGVATGQIDPAEAEKRGWDGNTGGRPIETIPEDKPLYHATTALSIVMDEGLKTRNQLYLEAAEQGGGKTVPTGLGGGQENALSFTEKKEYAERIAFVVGELRDLLNDDITPQQLLDRAASEGLGAQMIENLGRRVFGHEPTPEDIDRTYVRNAHLETTLPTTPEKWAERQAELAKVRGEAEVEWTPVEPWTYGSGEGEQQYRSFERPMTEKEQNWSRYELHSAYVWAQGEAEVAENPVMFSPNLERLKATPKEDIGIVEAQAQPGSKGYYIPAEWEWRTWSGDAVEVTSGETYEREKRWPKSILTWPVLTFRHTPGGHEHDQSAHAGPGVGGPTDNATTPLTISRAESFQIANRDATKLFGANPQRDSIAVTDRHSVKLKQEVASELAGRVPWSPEQELALALQMKHSASIYEDTREVIVRDLVDQWAGTSGDQVPGAIAMQLAAEREFGIEGARHTWLGYTETTEELKAKQLLDTDAGGRQAFLRTMYDNTQEDLKAKGIDGLWVYRGMDHDTVPPGHTLSPFTAGPQIGDRVDGVSRLQPMSAFSLSLDTAHAFTKTEQQDVGRLQAAWVPAARVLGYPGSGFGAYIESEVVVLGGEVAVSEIVFNRQAANLSQDDVADRLFSAPASARAPKPKVPEFPSPDDELGNADWTKQAWDLPTDPEELAALLDRLGIPPEKFAQLPVAKHQIEQGLATRQARHTPGGHEHDQSTHGKGGGGSEQAGPPALPVPDGPRAGYSEGYDPNKPPADGSNFSRDDSLYWVVAPLDRLRAIRESIGQPGAIGNRMLKAIQESDPADIPLEGVFRGARIREQDIHLYDERGQPYWQQGQTIDLGLTSFTSDRDTAERYITGKWNEVTDGKAGMLRPGDQPVLMVFSSGKAMQMPDTFGTAPDEYVTAGRFEITYVGSKTLFDGSRVMTLGLHQTDTIEVPTVPVKPPEPDYGWLIMPDGSKRPASMGDLWN